MAHAALRQVLMLRQVPRAPAKVTTRELQQRLESLEGMRVTERTIQRDLTELAAHFPLQCDERSKPFGWSFRRDGDLSIAAMDSHTAITLDMVQSLLEPVMPKPVLNSLRPQMEAAQKHLAGLGGRGYTRWSEKVAVRPRGLLLQPPSLKPAVLDAVYQALLEERQLEVRRNGKADWETLHPLAIVYTSPVFYLICRFWDYADVRQVALHRIDQARVLEAARQVPEAYTGLPDYLKSGGPSYRFNDKPLRLKLYFYNRTGHHLYETPLSDDQRLTPDGDEGGLYVQATVEDSHELRFWLRGFGSYVEVMAPKHLRREMTETAEELVALYGEAQGSD